MTDADIPELDAIMKRVAAAMAFEGRNQTQATKTDRFECLVVNLMIVLENDGDGQVLVASAVGIDPNLPKGRVGALLMERGMEMMMHGDEPDENCDTLHIDKDNGEIVGENGHMHNEECDHG